jgi:FkbM family methyltransferase
MTLRRRAFRALDRPGLRTLLGLGRSLEILARDRELCLLTPDGDGGWKLRARGSVLVGPRPNLPPPRRLRKRVLDVFCHVSCPGPGATVLDIGAGVGREALVFAELVGATGAVHCVEVHPVAFGFLRRVAELNGLDNVHCHQIAISDAPGEALIAVEDDPGLYYRSRVAPDGGGTAVPATTLADFVTSHRVETVDLLAMNIEGGERAALAGMGPVADRIRGAAIACHDFLAAETGDPSVRTKGHVKEFLAAHGFEVFERQDATPPWLGDFVYGVRRS